MRIGIGADLGFGRRRRGAGPALLRPPALEGAGRVGEALAVDAGDWRGAARIGLGWLRDGVPIPGAAGPVYVPGPSEDGARLACRVSAHAADGQVAAATTPAITIVFTHPLPVGGIADLIYTQGTGPHIVDVSPFFSGSSLSFSVTGDGVSVDPATGVVTISADSLLAGTTVLVTARNSGGAAELGFTLKVTRAEPGLAAPEALDAPDVAFVLGEGTGTVAAAALFVGEALAFSLDAAPGGVTIDPASGLVSVPLGAPFEGAVTVAARNAAGAAHVSFAVTVRAGKDDDDAEPEPPVAVAPGLVAAPALAGLAEIGAELTVEPGVWSGAPAPALSFQWRRDGADIPGAVARAYVPVAEDDGRALDVVVTATNVAGVLTAAAGPLRARFRAPEVTGELPEEVFDEGAGAQLVETAHVFRGENLSFAAEGASIDPATGVVAVPTDRPVEAAAITITAANSGGSAAARLVYTVRAEPSRQLGAEDIVLGASVWRPAGQTTTFSPTFAVPGLDQPFELEFKASPLDWTGEDPWSPVAALPGQPGVYHLPDVSHPAFPNLNAALFRVSETARNARLRFRWRRSPAHPWSVDSTLFTAPAPAPELPAVVAPGLVATPALAGLAEIGAELTVEPGVWSGVPAPALGFQWRRDGADIPGAVARAYVPVAEDDGRALDVVVTATNVAGVLTAAAGPLRARFRAPEVTGELPEEVFDEGAGAQLVETAHVFRGENLSFAAEGASIDPATGVVAVPTDRPVEAATITITAANSGGSAAARLVYTVEALPVEEPPVRETPALGAEDIVLGASVWRPAGQTTTFSPTFAVPGLSEPFELEFKASPLDWTGEDPWSPVAALPGEPGRHHLPDVSHPAFPNFNAALFRAGEARNGRLRFRWRRSAAESWSPDSTLFTVQAPAAVEQPAAPPASGNLQRIMLPALTGLQNAMSAPLTTYRHGGTNGRTDSGENIPVYTNLLYGHHAPVVVALGAFGRDARAIATPNGNRTAQQRLVEQLNAWYGSSSTNNAPRAVNGYCGQYEGDAVATVCIALMTPGVFDALAAATKTRIDLNMIAIGIAAMFVGSDTYPFPRGFGAGRERNMRGFSSNRNGVLNFKAPPRMLPLVVDRYMRLRGLGTLNAYAQSFNRANFAAQLNNAGGLQGAYDTFRQTWTLAVQNATYPNGHSAFGEGPTEAQLLTSIRGSGGVYRSFNFTLDQITPVFQEVIADAFSARIVPGVENKLGGEAAPAGSGWPTSGVVYGLKDGTNTGGNLRACAGVPATGGTAAVTNKAAWANMPNKGLTGRMRELDTTDGGASGVSWNTRSSIPYALHGTQFVVNMLAAAIAMGAVSPGDSGWGGADGPINRIQRGMADLEYIRQVGWRSIDKGRMSGDQNAAWFESNGTFTPALTATGPSFAGWLASA